MRFTSSVPTRKVLPELSCKLDLKEKVCCLFKRKVMKPMEGSGNFLLEGVVEVDEAFIGGSDENMPEAGKRVTKSLL
jgi:hypothetical protein